MVLYELMVREGTANVNPEGEQGVIAHAFIQVTPSLSSTPSTAATTRRR